jgi:phage/plasmid-associated DNA primase
VAAARAWYLRGGGGRDLCQGLFEAWETWCDQEGADPGTQVFFSRTMSERGVVKNFVEGRLHNGPRVWRGIGLQNPPSDGTSGKVGTFKKPCKQRGGENDRSLLLENEGKPLEDTPYEEKSEANRKNQGTWEQSGNGSAPPPSGPVVWMLDGLEIEYMPEGE